MTESSIKNVHSDDGCMALADVTFRNKWRGFCGKLLMKKVKACITYYIITIFVNNTLMPWDNLVNCNSSIHYVFANKKKTDKSHPFIQTIN